MARGKSGLTGIIHECCQCGESLDTSEFYKSDSRFYIATRHLPACKSCVNRLYRLYVAEYKEDMDAEDEFIYRKALHRICMVFDIYYSDDIARKIKYSESEDVMGYYLRMLNIVKSKYNTYDDTLNNNPRFFLDGTNVFKDNSGDKTQEELVAKWGFGLDPMDYNILESHYESLTKANPSSDSNQDIFIMDLCYIKMQQQRAIREGATDDFSKMTKAYRDTFMQAGLKTAQTADKADDISLGVANSFISEYTPEEYYKDKSLYKDYDGLGDYLKRFLLRPLKNLKYGTTEQDYEYFVPDGDDDG